MSLDTSALDSDWLTLPKLIVAAPYERWLGFNAERGSVAAADGPAWKEELRLDAAVEDSDRSCCCFSVGMPESLFHALRSEGVALARAGLLRRREALVER